MHEIKKLQLPKEIIPSHKEGNGRIILRIPDATFENAQIVFNAVIKNKEEFRKWLPFPDKTNRVEDSFSFLLSVQKGFEQNESGEYFIFEKDTGDFCGLVGMFHRKNVHDDYYEIGYWQIKEKCGKGYMTEAVQALEKFLFENGVNRVEIRNDTRNIASANIPKRLGYHLDGVLRQTGYAPYFNDWCNTNVWSKLKSEYRQKD